MSDGDLQQFVGATVTQVETGEDGHGVLFVFRLPDGSERDLALYCSEGAGLHNARIHVRIDGMFVPPEDR